MSPGPSTPRPPERDLPKESWEHFALYKSVREAIGTLPVYFRTETHIAGIMATDLHTLNTVLGATIEEQVVRTLNLIRATTWDSAGRYALYSFVRMPQTFPDVRLRRVSGISASRHLSAVATARRRRDRWQRTECNRGAAMTATISLRPEEQQKLSQRVAAAGTNVTEYVQRYYPAFRQTRER